MKTKISIPKASIAIFLILLSFIIGCTINEQSQSNSENKVSAPIETKLLRHIVLFKFKENADPAAITKVEEAFVALPGKVTEVRDFEWGLNNSSEGLNKGMTHCFTVTFNSEQDRAVYLPHPDHLAFVELLDDVLDDLVVVDYWTK